MLLISNRNKKYSVNKFLSIFYLKFLNHLVIEWDMHNILFFDLLGMFRAINFEQKLTYLLKSEPREFMGLLRDSELAPSIVLRHDKYESIILH